MNVPTIKMPADLAREKFDEYEEALRDREATAEDQAALLGYKALAEGKDLLDLHQVFRRCPGDEKLRPRLAVGRAHWTHVRLRRHSDGSAVFHETENLTAWVGFNGREAWHRRLPLPAGSIPEPLRPSAGRNIGDLSAVVPTIPPNLRPRNALHKYVILWEAEWTDVPTDPLLLRRLTESLYVVLAQWDLTELERAVLSGRLLA